MKTFKKFTLATLALLASLSALIAVGCGGGNGGKNEDSTSSSSETQETPCVDVEKGHDYSYQTGLCSRCGQEAPIPALPDDQAFPLVIPCTHSDTGSCHKCEYQGNGEEFNRLELFEDCYTIEIPSSRKIWVSFSVEEAGQYVLYTVGGSNGVDITRHNANSAFISPDGFPAMEKGDELYGFVNCGEDYYNAEWRATYCLSGASGTLVKLCFVRVGEPAWEAKSVYTKVYAQEINGVKAKDEADGMKLRDVPYDSEYFYNDPADGGDGYYYMGTKENPGALIYAAINKDATRLFTDAKFTNILKNSGAALNISNGHTDDGNYNILCYTPFIMNWKDENATWGSRPGSTSTEPEADLEKNCYQNFCNRDGVYPVNAELFQFLNLYVKANKPADEEISLEDWRDQKEYIWLSACYYYAEIPLGSTENPYKLSVGETTVSIAAGEMPYYTIEEEGSYTIKGTNENILLKVKDTSGKAVPCLDVTVEAPVVFYLSEKNWEAVEGTLTIVKNASAELELGKISVTIPAGEKAVVSGELPTVGQYVCSWTNEELSVSFNGNTYTAGTLLLLEGESCSLTVVNPTDEEIVFELFVREKGLEVGENQISMTGSDQQILKFYGEVGVTYTISSSTLEVWATENDLGVFSPSEKIGSVTVTEDGYVTLAVLPPDGTDSSTTITDTITFTKAE